MSTSRSDAIAMIDDELATLDTRRAKLLTARAALVALEDDAEDAPPAAPDRPRTPAPPVTTGAGQRDEDQVLQVLRSAPLPPKAISDRTGIKKHLLWPLLQRMRNLGTIRVTGTRRSCRYHVVP